MGTSLERPGAALETILTCKYEDGKVREHGRRGGLSTDGWRHRTSVANEVGDRHAAALAPSTAWPRPDEDLGEWQARSRLVHCNKQPVIQ